MFLTKKTIFYNTKIFRADCCVMDYWKPGHCRGRWRRARLNINRWAGEISNPGIVHISTKYSFDISTNVAQKPDKNP
jgi:hypothetical protein